MADRAGRFLDGLEPIGRSDLTVRLEIFGIGSDGSVYHDWQLSAAGPWSGWYTLGAPSNMGDTNSADLAYFISDAQDETYYANKQGQGCSAKMPNMWLGSAYAWPCGALVNVGFSNFGNTQPLTEAIQHWDKKLASWFRKYVNGQSSPMPAYLAPYFGGQKYTEVVDRTCDTCINGTTGGHGRGVTDYVGHDSSTGSPPCTHPFLRG